MSNRYYGIPFCLCLAAAVAGCDRAEAPDTVAAGEPPASAEQIRLAAAADQNWINLEGRVVSKTPSAFVLDYGDGSVTVEMDDWDWFQEGQQLLVGDRVSVTGRVDRDLLDRATLEAA